MGRRGPERDPETRQPNETRGGAGEAAGMGLEALTAPAPPCENMARLVEVFERGVGMRAGCPTFSLCGPVSQALSAGHLLVSYGVGLHCVQPEPYWRMRQLLPYNCSIYCSSNWCTIHVGSGTVTVIVLGKTTDSQGTG